MRWMNALSPSTPHRHAVELLARAGTAHAARDRIVRPWSGRRSRPREPRGARASGNRYAISGRADRPSRRCRCPRKRAIIQSTCKVDDAAAGLGCKPPRSRRGSSGLRRPARHSRMGAGSRCRSVRAGRSGQPAAARRRRVPEVDDRVHAARASRACQPSRSRRRRCENILLSVVMHLLNVALGLEANRLDCRAASRIARSSSAPALQRLDEVLGRGPNNGSARR